LFTTILRWYIIELVRITIPGRQTTRTVDSPRVAQRTCPPGPILFSGNTFSNNRIPFLIYTLSNNYILNYVFLEDMSSRSYARLRGHVLQVLRPLEVRDMTENELLTIELHPRCPICKGTGQVPSNLFVLGANAQFRSCSLCRSRGTILLPAEDLTEMVEQLRLKLS
jgi:hypothetical protein